MAQVKGRRDGVLSAMENRRRPRSSGEVEGLSWRGPRTLFLQKNSQGFGFTLRHFIVYPPESHFHSLKDEENGNAVGDGCRRPRLEPMDTIFVKSVKDNGPAQQAGLCTGDRLVKVNGETILGKTYSQVIELIQNSEDVLELSIMPKDEDVLQLAYSHDAYLKGNEPFTGGAQGLPSPPPLCCSASKPTLANPEPPHPCHMLLDNWQCRPSHAALPLDNAPAAPATHTSAWSRRSERSSDHLDPSRRHRGRSSSALSALDFHFANHNAAIASATLPPLRRSRLPGSAHADALCHQALSDWYYSQAEAAERMSPRHRNVSQDGLAGLGLGLALGPGPPTAPETTAEQLQRDFLLKHHQAAAGSHGSFLLRGVDQGSGPGGKSCSEDLLAAYAEYEHNYGRSVETLAKASALVSPRDQHQHPPTSSALPPNGRQSGQQVAEPQTRRVKEEQVVGSFCGKTTLLLQQAHSFKEASFSGPHLNWTPGSRSSPVDCDRELTPRPQSTPILSAPEEEVELSSPVSLHQEVVLRQKRPPGRRTHFSSLRRSHYSLPVDPQDLPGRTSSPGTPSPRPGETSFYRKANGSLAQQALDSLSSIPFIGSIKGRRSSYLLAITTERSKSCDEGLNTFREEGRVFSKLPKRVKSFFTDGSLESLRAQEEVRSKRHSTSELGTITFSDVRKEGWLHYKQILTEKGKKVGGGMRPWKRAFSVLRSHSLFLYKDKREAVLHGAGGGPHQDEHPPISVHGCLIDIAYSETKRKHTLRLTTQDFCEYLLQAEDREDMLSWIRVIRETSKTDNEEMGFSRQALINKKMNDYRKHSLPGNKPETSPRAHRIVPPFLLTKADNGLVNRASRCDENRAVWGINIMKKAKKTGSPKAFGVRLEDCQPAVNHQFVPLVVEMCCGNVEATGLDYTGIYRVPGNNAMVSNLQEHLNKGMDINTAEERWQDLNVISSLLKSFFRKLPEPLFTDDKYHDFIEANRIEDSHDRLKTMKKLIHDLPSHYYHTLKFLLGHLKKVADHAEKNKMEPRNLALVFGPTLVRTSEDNMTDMVTHMPDRYKIIETLILHCDWFFSDGELYKDEKAPEEKQDFQSVPNIDHLLSNIGKPGMPGETSDSTTSGSVKSKVSSWTRKDLNAKDFLPKSIISARKRKKCLSPFQQGSSTDEDSDHEPAKTSNYQGEEQEGGGDNVPVKGGGPGSINETHQEKSTLAMRVKEGRSRGGSHASQRDRQAVTQLSYPLLQSVYHPSYSTTQIPAKVGPTVPLWISPLRPPSPYRTGNQLPAAARYRKTRTGRSRVVSMNVELELGRGWRTDKVEVIRVREGPTGQRTYHPVPPEQPVHALDHVTRAGPPLSSWMWTEKRSVGPSDVVLRRSGLEPRDKTRMWRRHTVVV